MLAVAVAVLGPELAVREVLAVVEPEEMPEILLARQGWEPLVQLIQVVAVVVGLIMHQPLVAAAPVS